MRIWISVLLSVMWMALSSCYVRTRVIDEPVSSEAEIVESAPPSEQVEVMTVRPSPMHIWIRGHWIWRRGWVWKPGFWELRREHHVWVEGYWRRHRHGHVWVDGYWRHE